MNFIPYHDKIVIKPREKQRITISDDKDLVEAGEVLAVGSVAEEFFNVGDTVYFDCWGCSKTPEINGEEVYVVSVNSQVILGKTNGKPM